MVLTTFRLQKLRMGDFVHSHSAPKHWRLWAQVEATAPQGRGGVELVCLLEERPGGVTSSLAPLTVVPSRFGTYCVPGQMLGELLSSRTLHICWDLGPQTREHTNQANQVSVPSFFQDVCCFCFVFLTCSVL